MKFKPKRHIFIPVVIVIYTIVIAIYALHKYDSSQNKGSFFLVIGVNLALALALYFILKKRETLRNKNKKR
ncbi:MAG: LPXTG cell wall anchor domain-containing protein [Dysgonamonadaceae bacterium]|nr:LPXTG cell wall anchor domain-containing protein [Dysgonamonadaceae bacterium]